MNIAVIFAGGVGKRMRSKDLPKQFLVIHGKPIIVRTVELFEKHSDIDAIVVACVPEWIEYCEQLFSQYGFNKVAKVVAGGTTGQESIYKGLQAAEVVSGGERSVVLVHDGVRPLISESTITDNIDAVRTYGSAVTCVPAKETVVEIDEGGEVVKVPERSHIRFARAPQSYWLDELIAAHGRAIADGREFVDSASMMRAYGHSLHLVDGPEENIKITTPGDFFAMRAILDARENEQIYVS
ncbi:2-C-methyl-D-erythritol 4-phosphate cytidylyltransferase [Olsenella sp. DNF00959]|uniref:2-C-methyl-D-erythritol 4-phosphate cytidylyltransferase n=1 Tax=Olsenella sp. DNF00959 TaxID=1476999 RepID=UPI0007841A6E|nr:2-C-methyl-D-erythritol 4-phosphate cytidylyltransferase [Olsenella sp. DNF00959]